MLTALQCEKPDRVPVFDWFTTNSKQRIIAALQIENPDDEVAFAKAVGFDAISYGDIEGKFMATAFCKVLYDEDGGEHLQSEGLINNYDDLSKMKLPDVSDPGYFDDAKRYVDRYGKCDLAIFFMMRSGIMNTMYSLGFNDFCLKKFAAEVKLPWVFHSCGDVTLLFDDFMTLGFDGFNPFQPPVMDINAMHDRYGGKICFWGNIDLTYTLSYGTPEEVENEVKQRIAKLAPNGSYILSTANSIIDSCKTENILAMINAAKKFGEYPISV